MSESANRPKRKAPKSAFKPGHSGNPTGRPKLDEDTKKLRAMTKDQFKEVANALLTKTHEELQQILDARETPALFQWMIKVILVASEKGDYGTLDTLLNRLVGKVKDELDLEVKPGVKVINLTPIGKQIVLGKEDSE